MPRSVLPRSWKRWPGCTPCWESWLDPSFWRLSSQSHLSSILQHTWVYVQSFCCVLTKFIKRTAMSVWRGKADLSASYPWSDCEMGLTQCSLAARADRRAWKEELQRPTTTPPQQQQPVSHIPTGARFNVSAEQRSARRSAGKWSAVCVFENLERLRLLSSRIPHPAPMRDPVLLLSFISRDMSTIAMGGVHVYHLNI